MENNCTPSSGGYEAAVSSKSVKSHLRNCCNETVTGVKVPLAYSVILEGGVGSCVITYNARQLVYVGLAFLALGYI